MSDRYELALDLIGGQIATLSARLARMPDAEQREATRQLRSKLIEKQRLLDPRNAAAVELAIEDPGYVESVPEPRTQNRFVRPSIDDWREPYDCRPAEHAPSDCRREEAPYGCPWHCVVNNGMGHCDHVHDMG